MKVEGKKGSQFIRAGLETLLNSLRLMKISGLFAGFSDNTLEVMNLLILLEQTVSMTTEQGSLASNSQEWDTISEKISRALEMMEDTLDRSQRSSLLDVI